MRPGRPTLHMQTAMGWSERSLCSRQKCGAVITSFDMRRILSFGYNGPARHLPEDRCTGEEGRCGCLHAEENALLSLRHPEQDMRIFCTHSPCEMCAQRIIQVDIGTIVYLNEYRDNGGIEIARMGNIEVWQHETL